MWDLGRARRGGAQPTCSAQRAARGASLACAWRTTRGAQGLPDFLWVFAGFVLLGLLDRLGLRISRLLREIQKYLFDKRDLIRGA